MRKRMRALIAALLLGLVLAGCGGGDDDAEVSSAAPSSPPATEEPAAEQPAAEKPAAEEPAVQPAVGGVVPDTMVVDLASGAKVSVRSTVAADKPTLFWFWAPF